VMVNLAEWFNANQIPVRLLDLDTENKARGSLAHFFAGQAPKININTPAGLDAFIDYLADGCPAILADMGAGNEKAINIGNPIKVSELPLKLPAVMLSFRALRRMY
jgi:hypothetical protein